MSAPLTVTSDATYDVFRDPGVYAGVNHRHPAYNAAFTRRFFPEGDPAAGERREPGEEAPGGRGGRRVAAAKAVK